MSRSNQSHTNSTQPATSQATTLRPSVPPTLPKTDLPEFFKSVEDTMDPRYRIGWGQRGQVSARTGKPHVTSATPTPSQAASAASASVVKSVTPSVPSQQAPDTDASTQSGSDPYDHDPDGINPDIPKSQQPPKKP